MRYITQHSNLILLTTDGKAKYRFGPQGVLIVGTSTTDAAGSVIDPDTDGSLMRKFATDLAGATTISLELCGLGSLIKKDDAGSALTNLTDGYRGFFFEAPPIASPSATDIPATAGIYYEVLSGQVCYNGTTYDVGEQFVSDGSHRPTTLTGTYAVTIPPALAEEAEAFRNELFKVKHLLVGDEAVSYWLYTNGGFQGYTSIDSAEATWFGHIR